MAEHVAAEKYHVIRLRDGRRLSYAQYGDPGGFPILSAHGGLACRLDVAAAGSIAESCGVRLIAPDRPGVGRSIRSRTAPSSTGPATSPSYSTSSTSTGSR